MTTIDFTRLGGLNVYQDTLGLMQDSYDSRILAIAAAFGNNVFIAGGVITGANISNGWVVINGELLPFVGGPIIDLLFQIKKVETLSSESFADGSILPVYNKKEARIVNIDGTPFADFMRTDTIRKVNEDLADLITAFENHTHAWVDITGKPVIPTMTSGTFNFGDAAGADGNVTVPIPNQGGTNYFVCGTMVSQGSNFDTDNDVMWMIRSKTAVSFNIVTREVSSNVQSLRFEYIIFKF